MHKWRTIIFADINECVPQNPCKNGGSCHNEIGSYRCTCVAGSIGDNCQIGMF